MGSPKNARGSNSWSLNYLTSLQVTLRSVCLLWYGVRFYLNGLFVVGWKSEHFLTSFLSTPVGFPLTTRQFVYRGEGDFPTKTHQNPLADDCKSVLREGPVGWRRPTEVSTCRPQMDLETRTPGVVCRVVCPSAGVLTGRARGPPVKLK